ncbi:hypothetical protein MBCUT_19360 [Methanobrevibacter cuticularis]|uniref:Uncharacterized protein n=1 Tax=Methanobrevibacter cuticularis TaxID=47311 RepID=A0A166CS82_9EURY|nr:hypothetical protein MBCUT_19360 [Methanobrevibacter cuticularis]
MKINLFMAVKELSENNLVMVVKELSENNLFNDIILLIE